MKVDEFVEYLEIVHESGGDLDIEMQGRLIAIIESQRAALEKIRAMCISHSMYWNCLSKAKPEHRATTNVLLQHEKIARTELDKEV